MKAGPCIGFIVLVMVFGSATLGMLLRRKLPQVPAGVKLYRLIRQSSNLATLADRSAGKDAEGMVVFLD